MKVHYCKIYISKYYYNYFVIFCSTFMYKYYYFNIKCTLLAAIYYKRMKTVNNFKLYKVEGKVANNKLIILFTKIHIIKCKSIYN